MTLTFSTGEPVSSTHRQEVLSVGSVSVLWHNVGRDHEITIICIAWKCTERRLCALTTRHTDVTPGNTVITGQKDTMQLVNGSDSLVHSDCYSVTFPVCQLTSGQIHWLQRPVRVTLLTCECLIKLMLNDCVLACRGESRCSLCHVHCPSKTKVML